MKTQQLNIYKYNGKITKLALSNQIHQNHTYLFIINQQLMNCSVCNALKKYKCSSCKAPYCSLLCCQQHKKRCLGHKSQNQQINSLIIEDETIVKTDFLSDQSLRIPKDKLERLAKDTTLVELLKNKELRDRLTFIDNSKQRMTNAQQSMENEDFYNFFRKTMDILQMDNDLQ